MNESTNNIQINLKDIKEILESFNNLSTEKVTEIVKGTTITILGSVTIRELFKTYRLLNAKV